MRLLLAAIVKKTKDQHLWNENLILAGDFNLYAHKDDATVAMISNAGYREVGSLVGVGTNISGTEAYDRLFLSGQEYFKVAKRSDGKENCGLFRFFDFIYKDGGQHSYAEHLRADYTGKKNLDDPDNLRVYYERTWRKNQMSDHYPIWFKLLIDSSDGFLSNKLHSHTNT